MLILQKKSLNGSLNSLHLALPFSATVIFKLSANAIIMSKDKKSMPNPVGKKAPSDYQSGKTSTAKIEVTPLNKKKK